MIRELWNQLGPVVLYREIRDTLSEKTNRGEAE